MFCRRRRQFCAGLGSRRCAKRVLRGLRLLPPPLFLERARTMPVLP